MKDNRTNFISARNELYELGVLLNSKKHNIKILGKWNSVWILHMRYISVGYRRMRQRLKHYLQLLVSRNEHSKSYILC